MRTAVLIAGVAAAMVAATPAGAADRVRVMVVGDERQVHGPASVAMKRATVRVSGRRCRVAARTPLAVLARTRVPLKLRDYGRCGRRVRDAGALYVRAVAGERARGQSGWVYKVGRRLGTAPAGDRQGPFGRGGLRAGQRVLWFWCESAGACQRTLEAVPDAREVAPGATVRVRVRGYDDLGGGVAVAGAVVRLGGSQAVSDQHGVALLQAPAEPGRVRLTAEHPAMVRAFPSRVAVR